MARSVRANLLSSAALLLAGCADPSADSASGTATSGASTGASSDTGSTTSPAWPDLGDPAGPPATLFVRTDGDDACDGRADTPGPAGAASCAFATIEAAVAAATCGDVIAVRTGSYGEARIDLGRDCPARDPVILRGDGVGETWWMAALVPLDPTSCAPEGGGPVYRCALPPGALDPGPDPDPALCVVQRQTEAVRFEDENGVKGDMSGPVCLTWNTQGPADMASKPGHVAVDGADLLVHPWNGSPPTAADLWLTRGCGPSSSNGAVNVTTGSVVLQGMSIASGCGSAVQLRGQDELLRDLEVYTGTVILTASSTGARLESVAIRNAYRRPVNMGETQGADAWSTNSQALSVWGSGFLLRDVETYAAREGAGFANGASDGLVDGATFHGHHNHGFKIQDTNTRQITFRDVLAYNSQEAVFIECPQDIAFAHVTLPSGPVVVQGNPSAGCTPARLTFANSILCGMTWFAYGGDTWAEPGGHVLDRNVYVSGDPACDGEIRHIPSDSTFDLPAWQAWAADPCASCVRDPASVADDVAGAFVNFVYKDDTASAAPDFHLPAGAAAIDLGDPAWADERDRDGQTRILPPDSGCYER